MKRFSIISFLLLFVLAFTACQKKAEDPQAVRSKMRQAAGQPTPGLVERMQTPSVTPEEFNWPGELTDLDLVFAADEDMYARSFVIVFDVSGSMAGDKIRQGKIALKAFADQLKPSDYVALVPFSSHHRLVLPLTRVDQGKAAFLTEVDKLRDGGSTILVPPMETAYEELTRLGQRQLGYGEYTMVIVTDGACGDNPSTQVNEYITSTPIQIYTIGFQIGSNHPLNMPGMTTYVEADNLEELTEGLKGALAESVDMFQ